MPDERVHERVRASVRRIGGFRRALWPQGYALHLKCNRMDNYFSLRKIDELCNLSQR